MNRRWRVVTGLAAAGLVARVLSGTTGAQADSALAPLLGGGGASAASVVPDKYIVVLKDGATDDVRAASARAASLGGNVSRTYSHALHGYSAALTASELASVRADPAVAYVERDRAFHMDRSSITKPRAERSVSAAGTEYQRQVDSWGLDRIDQRKLPLSGTYYSQDATSDVGTVYVVSDGVYDSLTSLRMDQGIDLVGGSTTGDGCQELGTFVANIVGGAGYGVAKQVPISSVRVADCDGNADTSTVISGLEWVLSNDSGVTHGVVDLGIQEPADPALDTAASNLIQAGIPVVSGAFHTADFDACTVSPTEVPDVITVSGTTNKDKAPSSYSGTGACVDIWAPGQDITSVVPTPSGESGEWIATGDSPDFSATYVAGSIIQYKRWLRHYQPGVTATVAQIMAGLTSAATKGVISGVPAGTTSNLVFSKWPVTLPATTTGTDRLRSGQSLVRDGKSRLTSKAGAYYLQYRASDGHLCIYTAKTGKAHYCFGHSTSWANMNASGTVGQYDGYGQKLETDGVAKGASTLVISDKGYLYTKLNSTGKATWSSPH